jgi:hypothetical protein
LGEVINIDSPSVAKGGDISPQVGRLGAIFCKISTVFAVLAEYCANLSLSGGDVTAGDRGGVFLAAFTPTLYPSPQGGGRLLHPAIFLRLDIKRKNQKTKFDVYIPLPLVGRDTGWGYHSNGVFHA